MDVFDDIRNKFGSAHCIVTSNVLTVTDENDKRCIFQSCQLMFCGLNNYDPNTIFTLTKDDKKSSWTGAVNVLWLKLIFIVQI